MSKKTKNKVTPRKQARIVRHNKENFKKMAEAMQHQEKMKQLAKMKPVAKAVKLAIRSM